MRHGRCCGARVVSSAFKRHASVRFPWGNPTFLEKPEIHRPLRASSAWPESSPPGPRGSLWAGGSFSGFMKLLSGCATGQLLCQGGSSRQSRTSARTRAHECGSCKEGGANSSTEKLVAKDRPAQQSDSQKIHPKVLTDGLQAEPSQVPCLAPAFPRLCELTARVTISAEDAWACRSGRFCGRGKIRGAFAGRHPKLAWRPFQGVKCGKASKRRGSELQTRRGFSVGVP